MKITDKTEYTCVLTQEEMQTLNEVLYEIRKTTDISAVREIHEDIRRALHLS